MRVDNRERETPSDATARSRESQPTLRTAVQITLPPAAFVDFCRNELRRLGYRANFKTDWEMLVAYLGVNRRLVAPQPRTVVKAESFNCPPEHITALRQIETRLRDGKSVVSHLSTKIRDITYNDALLNDWGIHHLHLGTCTGPHGFVKRTRQLLYCRFTDTHAYLIAVLPHGKWTTIALLEALHANWPDEMARFRAEGVAGDQLTDPQIRELRRKNANYVLQMRDGTCYWPLGGGTTSSGSNPQDIVTADRILHARVRDEKADGRHD